MVSKSLSVLAVPYIARGPEVLLPMHSEPHVVTTPPRMFGNLTRGAMRASPVVPRPGENKMPSLPCLPRISSILAAYVSIASPRRNSLSSFERAWKDPCPDLLALFRALDRMDLSLAEISQHLIRQLFVLDADHVEALRALD